MRVAGFVFAGGQSQRMGQDKALLELAPGKSLLAISLAHFQGRVDEVLLSAPENHYGKLSNTSYVPDTRQDKGPLAGIEAALIWCQNKGIQWLLSRPVDLPFLPADWLFQLFERVQANQVLSGYITLDKMPAQEEPPIPQRPSTSQPLAGVWHTSLTKAVSNSLDHNQLAVRNLHQDIGSLGFTPQGFNLDSHSQSLLFNINTKADYQEACKLYACSHKPKGQEALKYEK